MEKLRHLWIKYMKIRNQRMYFYQDNYQYYKYLTTLIYETKQKQQKIHIHYKTSKKKEMFLPYFDSLDFFIYSTQFTTYTC